MLRLQLQESRGHLAFDLGLNRPKDLVEVVLDLPAREEHLTMQVLSQQQPHSLRVNGVLRVFVADVPKAVPVEHQSVVEDALEDVSLDARFSLHLVHLSRSKGHPSSRAVMRTS